MLPHPQTCHMDVVGVPQRILLYVFSLNPWCHVKSTKQGAKSFLQTCTLLTRFVRMWPFWSKKQRSVGPQQRRWRIWSKMLKHLGGPRINIVRLESLIARHLESFISTNIYLSGYSTMVFYGTSTDYGPIAGFCCLSPLGSSHFESRSA